MGSIRGFRCRHCRAELLAPAGLRPRRHGPGVSPILCCGQPLRPLDTGQVLSAPLPRRRSARCPHCGTAVQIIVQPEGPLVCMPCGTLLEMADDQGGRRAVAEGR